MLIIFSGLPGTGFGHDLAIANHQFAANGRTKGETALNDRAQRSKPADRRKRSASFTSAAVLMATTQGFPPVSVP